MRDSVILGSMQLGKPDSRRKPSAGEPKCNGPKGRFTSQGNTGGGNPEQGKSVKCRANKSTGDESGAKRGMAPKPQTNDRVSNFPFFDIRRIKPP